MTATEQASAWCHWLASRGVPLSQDEMRAMFISGIERATEELRVDNERMREGEKWAATMFCNIMVQAMSGIADSAIIAHQQYTAEHSLAAVKQCAETAMELRVKLAAASERLRHAEEWIRVADYTCTCGGHASNIHDDEFCQVGMTRKFLSNAAMAQQKGGCNPNESEAKK